MHRLQELVRLHREGTGARRVATLLGMSPNTERTYRRALEAAELLAGPADELPSLAALRSAVEAHRPRPVRPAHEVSSIERFRPRVEELLARGLTPRPIYDRLRQEDTEFDGSYWAVKRLCRRLSGAREVRAEDVAIPVQTDAGEVAQVDFGYAGKILCPRTHVLRRAWVFVMTLGFSRHMYAEVVFDQKAATWVALHMRAFHAFGGVPKTVVPDNLKSAVIRCAFGVSREAELNRTYREMARHYGFQVDPTPPRSPRKKGKVESSVKYVKRNALLGRDGGEDLDDVNRALHRWVAEVAGTRRHGTTGRQPLTVFREEEQATLRALPNRPYEVVVWRRAKVHQDTHISFDGRLYSVPWRWVGKDVWVRATPGSVVVFGEDERIATHSRKGKSKRSTEESHLPEHRRDRRHRSRDYWEKRAAQIGPETLALAVEIFDSDEVLSQLRKVQAIVTHLERYPTTRAESASERARFFGTLSYRGVKSILTRALDLEPLPRAVVPSIRGGERPRFARNMQELIASAMGVPSEPH